MNADLDDLFALYAGDRATAMYDEIVTEREHALQAAALAEAAGADDATVAAALLHDVGRLLGGDPAVDGFVATDRAHDRVGQHYLARWFGPDVTGPVGLHVEAKRYLCGTEPEYLGLLSPVSIRSLAVQGGPMAPDEIEAFRSQPGWESGVALRRWDDRAKSEEPAVKAVGDYRPLLAQLAGP